MARTDSTYGTKTNATLAAANWLAINTTTDRRGQAADPSAPQTVATATTALTIDNTPSPNVICQA